jgi:predicted transcriptional regulator
MNISINQELKKTMQMEAQIRDVNWSRIAEQAFRDDIDRAQRERARLGNQILRDNGIEI